MINSEEQPKSYGLIHTVIVTTFLSCTAALHVGRGQCNIQLKVCCQIGHLTRNQLCNAIVSASATRSKGPTALDFKKADGNKLREWVGKI